jgi:predicted GIY-YIG superfamily endonuclease
MEIDSYADAPDAPGCYIFKNKSGEIIYIGKSKSLKKRLRQHFSDPAKKEGKYFWMRREIYRAELILTPAESDALILECELIKKHKPKYNAQLVRDAEFYYINIGRESYPSITVVGENGDLRLDGLRLGKFLSQSMAERAILELNEIFLTPVCQNSFVKKRRACLNYHIKKCRGPCERLVSESDYAKVITKAAEYLKRYPNPDFKKDIVMFFRARNEKFCYIFFIKNGVPVLKTDNLPQFFAEVKSGSFENLNIPLNNLLEINAKKLFLEFDPENADKLIKEFNKFSGDDYEIPYASKKKTGARRGGSSFKRARV